MSPREPDADPKEHILSVYTKLAEKHRVHPTTSAMVHAGVTRNTIRHHFGSLSLLHKAACKAHPEVFATLNDADVFSPQRKKEVRDAVENCTRFIITTAVAGQAVHKGFLASLHTWCTENEGKLLILTAADPASGNDRPPLDKLLENELIVTEDLALNRSVFVSSIKLSAKQIEPMTGLSRIGQRDGSFVYANPKQRLKLVATAIDDLPCALMTTGACTLPDYEPNPDMPHSYMSRRTAYIATHDHCIGAIIIETDGPKKFHYRQVQADKQGRFPDLGILYTPKGRVDDYRPEVLVLGDWHSRSNDPVARECFVTGSESLASLTKPSAVVIHDGFDGDSISHHEKDNITVRAQQAALGHLSLEDEVRQYAADLTMLAEHFDEVLISKSNHDLFLDRYLAEGRYHDDPLNTAIALRMATVAIEGNDPLEWAVRRHLDPKVGERIRFFRIDDSYRVGGFEVAAHGHQGANGARGGTRAMEEAYGSSVSGHVHTPEILRKTVRVGTCSRLRLRYNRGGPSSWLASSCLIYPNGAFQLINCIDGEFHA